MKVFPRPARKQCWLAVLLLVLLVVAPLATEASLIPTIEVETSGTGLGAVDTVLTIQSASTDTSGCVAWDGSADVVGPAACPAGIPGGDEQAINQTYALSELDFSSAFNLRLVFNIDEPQSGAEVDDITIEDLELTIYEPDGSVCFTSGAFSSISFPDTSGGVGNAGFVFRLDAEQAAAAQACFDDPANRIGLAAELANAGQGPETFYLADAADLMPASADLSVTKTDSADPAIVGSPLSYTLTVTNDGPNAATGVTVVDTVPASLSGVTATSPDGTCTVDGRVVTCDLGDLAVGATATVTITGTPTVTGTITNAVAVVGDDPDPDTDDNTDSVTTQVEDGGGMGGTDVANLWLTKTDSPDPVMVGDELTYTVTVTNGGPDPAPGTTITDQLPSTVDYGSATVISGGGSCSSSGHTVVCELGTLAVGDVVTVEITVTPQSTGIIQNTAQVSADADDATPGNNSATESTQVVDVAPAGVDLAVVKGDSTDPVTPGADFDYVLEVTNQGTTDATGVTLRDDLPASVTIVSLPPGCTADGNMVTCDLGSLGAGLSTTVTLTVQAPAFEAALTNTATVSADQPDTATGDNSDTEGTTVQSDPPVGPDPGQVDLSVRKSDSPDPVPVGAQIVYRLLVSNAGPDLATGVRVVDDLSPLVSFVSVAGGLASCSGTDEAVVCDISSLSPGESVEILVTVQAEAAGRATDTVTVAPGGETDVNPDNNSDTEDTTIGSPAPVADVSVTKTGSPDPVQVGGVLTYTLLVDNAGPDAATGVQLTDLLPMEVEYGSSSTTQGSCAEAAGVVTCDLGTLGVDATATVTILVRPLAPGSLVNTAVVSADQSDPDTAQNVTEAEVTADESVLAIPTASEWGLLLLFLGLGGVGFGLLGGRMVG